MGYRLDEFAPGEMYHIYTRSVEKRKIFLDEADRKRLMDLMIHCLPNGLIPSFSTIKKLDRKLIKTDEGVGLVDVLCYCLMSNHIHLLLLENVEGGISKYMQRLLNSYAKYFNARYDRSGSLFGGPFKAVAIVGNDQFLHVSRYIHLNPYVAHMVGNPFEYKYSSLSDYVSEGHSLLTHSKHIHDVIGLAEYKKFVLDHSDFARSLPDVQHLFVDFDEDEPLGF